MPTLELDDIRKSYGSVRALDGVSLTIEEGEFFVVLGPSASGKTTTLRCIAGVERVDSGRVVFEGEDLTEAPVQGRDMAMVFQTFALYPHLTIRENLAYPLREQGLSPGAIGQRVGETAAMLKLSHALDRKPATASGGEQQRIAIGRALIRNPKLLLLDEPLTNLDAKLRHDTRAEFKRLHRELGMTMLYATPDELEALSMGQRIGVLRDGRIVQTGSPDTLYESPDNTFVAEQVGSPRMNLVRAANGGDGTVVKTPFADFEGGPWTGALGAFSPGTELLFGFRPHDVAPAEGDPRGPRFESEVHLTEPLGDVTVLDMVAADVPFRMVMPEERAVDYKVGDRFEVELKLERSHLFALDTGTAIR